MWLVSQCEASISGLSVRCVYQLISNIIRPWAVTQDAINHHLSFVLPFLIHPAYNSSFFGRGGPSDRRGPSLPEG